MSKFIYLFIYHKRDKWIWITEKRKEKILSTIRKKKFSKFVKRPVSLLSRRNHEMVAHSQIYIYIYISLPLLTRRRPVITIVLVEKVEQLCKGEVYWRGNTGNEIFLLNRPQCTEPGIIYVRIKIYGKWITCKGIFRMKISRVESLFERERGGEKFLKNSM